jgi:DNA-binding CsgD family transcriptional regulator
VPARSQRITLRDMRTVIDTVYECRDLWADPSGWQAHLMRRACTLAGCRVGLYFEMADHAGVTANRILSADDAGWESAGERHTVIEGLAQRPLRYSPLWAAFADALSVRGRHAGTLTARQDRVISAPAWQASEMYDRHVRPTRLGEAMLSAVWLPQLGSWSAWSLVTDRGDPAPSSRHERLARLLHQRVAPLIGTHLSTWRDRTVDTLSATRRRVLEALLDGHGEPDIARRSCRSRSAVHEHVTAIYRHFGVSSRGELGAFFLRRRPGAAGRAAGPQPLVAWLDRPWADEARN